MRRQLKETSCHSRGLINEVIREQESTTCYTFTPCVGSFKLPSHIQVLIPDLAADLTKKLKSKGLDMVLAWSATKNKVGDQNRQVGDKTARPGRAPIILKSLK